MAVSATRAYCQLHTPPPPTTTSRYEARGKWADATARRRSLEQLGALQGYESMEDWYNVTSRILREHSPTLFHQYSSSPIKLLRATFPEKDWVPHKFPRTPKGYWNDLKNQEAFLKDLGDSLSVNFPKGWYQVTSETIQRYGGSGLLKRYGTRYNLLRAVYPDIEWYPHLFRKSPTNIWKDDHVVKQLLKYVEKELKHESLEDWHRVSTRQLQELKGDYIVKKRGGLYQVLTEFYPDQDWQRNVFQFRGKKAMQNKLALAARQLFLEAEVLQDSTPRYLEYEDTSRAIELDVHIPSLNIAFEYQGFYHY
eukprot:TRINITY_DN7365_c0_g1_i1.p1 TRINITY_DN7365_c0_g1~~TRINITY_DN7365_c0_g1_i1.p1  ORF type:complete len:309 (+),score=42.29 TRINITY_DN7365_c0_g1_i1:27-953(+)